MAKESDIIAFMGEPFPYAMRGIVVDNDGEILGLAGVLHSSPKQAFSIISQEIKDSPRIVVKAIREFRLLMRYYEGEDVYAAPSEIEPTAEGFLSHVGFTLYNDEVFKWQIQ